MSQPLVFRLYSYSIHDYLPTMSKVYFYPLNNSCLQFQGDHIEPWTPYNADLHMQGIKVMVKEAMPKKIEKGDAFEDTMLLLEMMKEKKQKENKLQKEERIRAMAMEKKRKLSNQSNNQYLKLTF